MLNKGIPSESDRSEEIVEQMRLASKILEVDLLQPSLGLDMLDYSLEEIRKEFKLRLDIFLRMLSTVRTSQKQEISEENTPLPAEVDLYRKKLEILNRLDLYISSYLNDSEGRTLYEQQIPVFEDMRSFLEKGNTAGYVKLPTGYGKTVIFSEFVEAIGQKTLIVVPTQVLVDQTEERLGEFAADLDVGKIYTHAKQKGKDVTIITYDSLLSGLKKGTINPDEFDCLILDEAHRSLSEARIEAVSNFSHAIRIGFSATPEFHRGKKVADILPYEIHAKQLREAIEEDCLAPVRVILAKVGMDLSNVDLTGGEFNQRQLEKAINVASLNQAAVQLYLKSFEGQKTVVYCVGVNHAKALADEFRKEGVRAAYIKGDMSKNEKEQLLRDLKAGQYDVICNAKLLTEGFDDPAVEVCFNLAPTASRVVAEQRGGRVLRKNKNNPDKVATIVDFISNNNSTNSTNRSILFSQILSTEIVAGAVVFPLKGKKRDQPGPLPIPNIEGIEVVVDEKEIMAISNIYSDAREGRSREDNMAKINDLIARGWVNYKEFAAKYVVSERAIRKVAEVLNRRHPDKVEFCFYGNIFFHPDILGEVDDLVTCKGWITKKNLLNSIKLPFRFTRQLEEKIEEEIKQDCEVNVRVRRKARSGYPIIFLRPEFIKNFEAEFVMDNPGLFIELEEIISDLGIPLNEVENIMAGFDQRAIFRIPIAAGDRKTVIFKDDLRYVRDYILRRKGYKSLSGFVHLCSIEGDVLFDLIDHNCADIAYGMIDLRARPINKSSKSSIMISPEVVSVIKGLIEGEMASTDEYVEFEEVFGKFKNFSKEYIRKILVELNGNKELPGVFARNGKWELVEFCPRSLYEKLESEVAELPTVSGLAVKYGFDEEVLSAYLPVLAGGFEAKGDSRIVPEVETMFVENVLPDFERWKEWIPFDDFVKDMDLDEQSAMSLIEMITGEYSDVVGRSKKAAFYYGVVSTLMLESKAGIMINPDKIDLIKMKILEIKKSGLTVFSFAEEFGLNEAEMKNLLQYCEQRKRYSGMFEKIYILPQLERRIRSLMPPKEWVPVREINNLWLVDDDDLAKLAQKRKENPELFGEFWSTNAGSVVEFCSPELEEYLAPESVLNVPEGYTSVDGVRQKLNMDTVMLAQTMEYLGVKPERHKNEEGVIDLYLSPDNVQKMDEKRPCPEDWMSCVEIANDCEVPLNKVLNVVRRLVAENPAIGREFFDRETGRAVLAVNPDFFDEIEEKL